MGELQVGKTDTNYIEIKTLLGEKVSKAELMSTGWNGQYGINFPMPPEMLWAHGDGRTIHIAWKPSIMLTNHDHYLIQVSNDQSTWGALVFDGSGYVGLPGTITEVWDNSIDHTRIPYNGNAVQTLWYRVATMTKLFEQSEWSDPISGNTFFIEACDLRPGPYFNEFEYVGSGEISVYGPEDKSWDRYIGPNSYNGSGSMTLSGAAATEVETPGVITYGSEYVFNSALSSYGESKLIDSTHFIVVYKDAGNSNYGTAIIGTISGTTITYGSEYVFNSAETSWISVSIIDSTHVAITYSDVGNSSYGTAIIGTISNDDEIAYGSEYVFNSSSTVYISSDIINSTSFVISYRDAGNSYYGTAIIGTISGTTITYGSEYVFSSSILGNSYSCSVLDSTHFVITFQDQGNSYYGTSIIGVIANDDEITFGTAVLFNSADTYFIDVIKIDSTHFAISYRDDGNSSYGTSIIGTVSSGDVITYGSEYVFNSGSISSSISTSLLDSSSFIITYYDDGNSSYGTAIIGTISNDDEIAYGSEYVFNSESTNDVKVSAIDSSNLIISYRDGGNSNYGTAIIGTIS